MTEDRYSTKRGRASIDSLRDRANGTKLPYLKIDRQVTELFIILPKDINDPVVFTSHTHQFSVGHGPSFKVLKQCASPAFNREKDVITDLGWKVRDAYGKSDSKSVSEFWRHLVHDQKDHILVLDINNIKAGVQIFKMPKAVAEVVIPYIQQELDDNDGDLYNLCDPEDGKILVIETNGKKGFEIKYTETFFDVEKPSRLFTDKIIPEHEFDNLRVPDMKVIQPAFSKQEFEDYLNFCYDEADKLGINLDDLGADNGGKVEEITYDESPRQESSRGSQSSRGGNSRANEPVQEDAPRRDTRMSATSGNNSSARRGSAPAQDNYDDVNIEEDINIEDDYEAEPPARTTRAPSNQSSGRSSSYSRSR